MGLGVLTVDPAPAGAVAAAVYSVVGPSLRLGPILARDRGFGGVLDASRGRAEQKRSRFSLSVSFQIGV